MFCLRPGGIHRPRKTLVPLCVQCLSQIKWLPVIRRQSLAGSHCRRFIFTARVTAISIHSDLWLFTRPHGGLADSRHNSCKTARLIKRFLLLQDVITGACQFVRQRLDGNRSVGLGFLALIETLGCNIEAQCKVGGFYKGPG